MLSTSHVTWWLIDEQVVFCILGKVPTGIELLQWCFQIYVSMLSEPYQLFIPSVLTCQRSYLVITRSNKFHGI